MKNHIKRISTFLLYTLVFNVISFAFYFFPAFFSHDFYGVAFILLGIAQICFTVFYFTKIPLPKSIYESCENKKDINIDFIIYFIILSVLSVLIVFWRFEGDSWFTYIFFNTFYPFATSFSFLDNIPFFIALYIIENAVKTYCLYKNTVKKTLPKTAAISLSTATGIIYIAFLVVMLIKDILG